MSQQGLPLADVVKALRSEILEAAQAGQNEDIHFSAHSDDVGRAFRLMSATCSDRSRPAVPIDVGRGGGSPAGQR